MGSSTKFFSQIFEKLMQFMSQTSLSPKLVSFFARFISSEILPLPEMLFCLVEITFLLIYMNYWTKSRNFEKQVFNPKLI